MPSSELLGLQDESDARRSDCRFHLFRLMANHHKNPLGRRQLERRVYDVFDESLAACAVQHFGLARFHPGAEASGQDDDSHGSLHHETYYAVCASAIRRRRPSCASLTTTPAVAAGSWRTRSALPARLPAMTFKPILKSSSMSFSTGSAASFA